MLYQKNLLSSENKNVKKVLAFIVDCGVEQDEKLPPERELAKQLGIGRNSLREAMKILEAMGVVEILHGSGTYLRKTDTEPGDSDDMWLKIHKDEIFNMITVREALDLKAIELIPEDQYMKIRDDLRASISAVKQTRLTNHDMLLHDLEFHNIIRKAANNEILLNICNALTGTIYDERKILFNKRSYVEQSLWEHMQIANAFGSGDVNLIKQAYCAHLATTRSGIEYADPNL